MVTMVEEVMARVMEAVVDPAHCTTQNCIF
jgi:hypothetical protein